MSESRICTKCLISKEPTEFYTRSDGNLHWTCKDCFRAAAKASYENRNRDEYDARVLAWRENNRPRIRAFSRKWASENPEKQRKAVYRWNAKNPDRVKAIEARRRAKLSSDPKSKINSSVSRGIRNSLSTGAKGGVKWESLVGYTLNELVDHLESMFTDGMTWENYGRGGWHIDHVIPLAAHNFSSQHDEDFRHAWALQNLQPLWEPDNASKKDKLSAPFQPSFAFGQPKELGTFA